MNKKIIVGAVVALCLSLASIGVVVWQNHKQPGVDQASRMSPIVSVFVPAALSPPARIGRRIFEAKCALCHGENAAGQRGIAPPLVHKIYEPSHHGDESFQRAVALGVRGHHWQFGNMPPVEGLSRGEVSRIIRYIRELQRANGIQ